MLYDFHIQRNFLREVILFTGGGWGAILRGGATTSPGLGCFRPPPPLVNNATFLRSSVHGVQ